MFVAILAGLVGCTGSTYGYEGYNMVDHFPLDGTRSWKYSNETVDHNLIVEMVDGSSVDSFEIKNLEFWQADPNNLPATLLFSLSVSSDDVNGVHLHGYTYYADPVPYDSGDSGDTDTDSDSGAKGPEDTAAFTPPVVLADKKMVPGDSELTDVNGTTWTTTLEGQESCANHWVNGDQTWDCLHVSLDDGDGDYSAGSPASGHFWLAPRYGMSWFQLTGDLDKWVLADADWSE
jgi:hypothetical protein